MIGNKAPEIRNSAPIAVFLGLPTMPLGLGVVLLGLVLGLCSTLVYCFLNIQRGPSAMHL